MLIGVGVASSEPNLGRMEVPRFAQAVKITNESAVSST
jgi:hypothetical protein